MLHRPVGGCEVMHAQLDALTSAARSPKITLQVVPTSLGAHAGLAGMFVIASFHDAPDVASMETPGEGIVVERPRDVRTIMCRYDALRAEALPQSASIDLLQKVMKERWS